MLVENALQIRLVMLCPAGIGRQTEIRTSPMSMYTRFRTSLLQTA